MSLDYGTLILYRSLDCENWEPVKAADIPDWIKEMSPEAIARMVDGEAVQDTTSETGTDWFVVKKVLFPSDEAAIQAAQAKRERRRRLLIPDGTKGSMRLH